jgi:hypothetical protein
MTDGHSDSLMISVVDMGRARHSDDEASSRAISLTYPAYPVADKRHEVFLPHLAKFLHLSGNNPRVHVDLSRFRTLNRPGRGSKDVHSIAIGVNWLCVGWAGAFLAPLC